MKNVEWVDYLALRASYGVQGNIGDNSSPDLIIQLQGRQDLTQLRYATLIPICDGKKQNRLTWGWNSDWEEGSRPRWSITTREVRIC